VDISGTPTGSIFLVGMITEDVSLIIQIVKVKEEPFSNIQSMEMSPIGVPKRLHPDTFQRCLTALKVECFIYIAAEA